MTAERTRQQTAQHLAGLETAQHLAGLETAQHLAGPETAQHLAGPETAQHLAGPETAQHLAGPETITQRRADAARASCYDVRASAGVMGGRGVGRFAAAVALVCALLAGLGHAAIAHADARANYLVRLMTTSDQFRVRAQAALALAQAAVGDTTITEALERALRDDHPAVRAAAVSSLQARGDASVLEALRAAKSDRDPSVASAATRAVTALERVARANGGRGGSTPGATPPPTQPTPSGPARFYVGVATPATTAGLSPAVLTSARSFIVQNVTQIPGVQIAPANESNTTARRVIQQGRLVGYYLDVSITSVEERPGGGLRAAVSVIVNTYPGRDMRSILQGAATVSGGGAGDGARQQAIEAALTGALRRLPQALDASAGGAP